MALNIKNAETERLIGELARVSGESKTAAVTIAVRERLAQLRAKENAPLAERLVAIGKECAARLDQRTRSLDHDALLYDRRGLPK
ncbi:type II toxin-antitoxin system VapB family antitoxin [Methylocystis suflitae]|uniref:type II toxin-antitoxin system VapB family antitoxin n=1 Tax=Methylocystis suflitae TaxID=2951405 RepID=UPI002109677C|nr:type II toxin-antitoxin system VapB family antitoxin [Methylocystis suflitae]MCQ4189147.1 type II toxin-antitoxin system VapB family antitoxin [Methylocystis suflitae]